MARRSDDRQLNLPVTQDEFDSVKADADRLGLSVQNYLRQRLGLELREAGGVRAGGFEPGNKLSPGRPPIKKKGKK